MTTTVPRTVRTGPLRAPLIGAILVVAAVVLVLVGAPTVIRSLIALPILVGVSGLAAATLITGGTTDRDVPNDRESPGLAALGRGVDTWVFAPLAVVMGLLAVLGSILALAAAGIGIGTTSIAVAVGGTAMLLLVVGAAVPRPVRPATDLRRHGRRALPVIGAGVLIIAAVAGARWMQPTAVEQYSTLEFSDPAAYTGAPLISAAGGSVTLNWTLSTFGYTDDDTPSVTVTVGGEPAGVTADLGVTGSPLVAAAQASRTGSVTFDAPPAAGRYLVRVEVAHTGPAGSTTTEELTVPLQVSP